MRIVSILTALVVCAVLYLAVFERAALLDFAGAGPAPATAAATAAATDVAAPETAPAAGAADAPAAVSVVALRSAAREIDGAVVLRGRTEAARQVEVKAETSGQVVSQPLRKGAEVAEGAVLCRLDPGTREVALVEAEARKAGAEAALADAEVNASAASRLSREGFAAETRVTSATAAVQSARAALQSAEAGIAAARKEIERLTLRAPFAGLLESDTAEIGAFLQPGALCATVIQLDPIRMVGFAPETQVDRIEVGARAGVRLASGREAAATVTFVSRAADPATRTFRVEAEADNSDVSIRDGQTAEILIGADGARAHLLPQSALTLSGEGALGVRTVGEDGIVAFSPVGVLRDTVDGVWVAGLPDDAAVIVVGQEFVTEGTPVRVTWREPQG